MSEKPQAGDVFHPEGYPGTEYWERVVSANKVITTRKFNGQESHHPAVRWSAEKWVRVLPVPQPAPQPEGGVIEVAVMESSDRGRHIYAVGQLGLTAASHAVRSFTPDRHIATIRAVLPPRSVPVAEGTVTTP